MNNSENVKYPVPVSPLPPCHSNKVEQLRAERAVFSAKHGPAFSCRDICYEDEWIVVVNKPSGIYSEHVVASVPSVLGIEEYDFKNVRLRQEEVNTEQTRLATIFNFRIVSSK